VAAVAVAKAAVSTAAAEVLVVVSIGGGGRRRRQWRRHLLSEMNSIEKDVCEDYYFHACDGAA
jgi:hypothetical protein